MNPRVVSLVALLSAVAAGPAAMAAGPVGARDQAVVPTLSLIETYTDNIALVSANARQSEWVTQIVPGIAVHTEGPRLRFNLRYAPEITYYAEGTRANTVFQKGDAVANLQVAEKLLYVEAGGKVDQYPITLQTGPFSISNISSTDNQATISTGYVTPYLLHDFGTAAKLDARYRYSVWKGTGQTEPGNNVANRVDLRLESGDAFKHVGWYVTYFGDQIKYDTQQDTFSEDTRVGTRVVVTPTLALLAFAGYERYDPGVGDLVSEGPKWSTGFEWNPSPRTRIAATGGQRFYENTYSFEFRHRTRLTTWSITYADDITTARSQFYVPQTSDTAATLDQMLAAQYPDPVARQKAVQDFIAKSGVPSTLNAPINFLSDQFFRQQLWLASVLLRGARNTLILRAFWENRDVLFNGLVTPLSGDFASTNTTRYSGVGLAWSWQMTPRLTSKLDTGWSRNQLIDISRVDDFTFVLLSITRELRPKLSGTLQLRRQQTKSTLEEVSYTENAVIASLLMHF